MSRTSLYAEAVDISEEFLGPAGKRFLDRQIVTHLKIEPAKLQRKHLEDLVKWVQLAFALLTDDTQQVKEYSDLLLSLGNSQKALPNQNQYDEVYNGHKR